MTSEHKFDHIEQSEPTRKTFYTVAIFAQVTGIITLVMFCYWHMNSVGGYNWQTKTMAYHPLLMFIAFGFFQGEAILIYRLFRYQRKSFLKWAHVVLHTIAVALAPTGVSAIIISKMNQKPAAYHFRSTHSWTGLALLITYLAQYVISFLSFMFPALPKSVRAWVLPLHRYTGLFLFFFTIAQLISGLSVEAVWGALVNLRLEICGPDLFTSPSITSCAAQQNSLTLLLMLYGFLIGYLVISEDFKRAPMSTD